MIKTLRIRSIPERKVQLLYTLITAHQTLTLPLRALEMVQEVAQVLDLAEIQVVAA